MAIVAVCVCEGGCLKRARSERGWGRGGGGRGGGGIASVEQLGAEG